MMDGRLTGVSSQIEKLKIFLGSLPAIVLAMERIVSHAKRTAWEQILFVTVVRKGPRLTHQPVDDVAILDPVLVLSPKARQLLDLPLRIPYFQAIGVDPNLDLLPNQATMDRIGVLENPNRTGSSHRALHSAKILQPRRGQAAQDRQLLSKTVTPPGIELIQQLPKKPFVLLTAVKVPTAPEHQGLVYRPLEPMMTLLHVAVFMRTARLDLRREKAVMVRQGLVAIRELLGMAHLVHRRGQPICPVMPGNPTQLPQGVLQSGAEAFITLGETDRCGLPVRIRQHEVVHHVIKGNPGNRDP